MTERKIDMLFPEISKIPKQFALEGSTALDRYLVKGELRQWNGPFHEVFSPICVRNSSGIRPLRIGSYPLLTETESTEALHAARTAFDNGSGLWPSMTAEQRITHFEDFVVGNEGEQGGDCETHYVGDREIVR